MPEMNSQMFTGVYDDLGVDVKSLGCIMLDVDEKIDIKALVPNAEDDLYTSPDKDKFWIKGDVGGKTPHVTLLYGLMESGQKWKHAVDDVLEGWSIPDVKVSAVGFFPSPYADEDYSCVVAHIEVTPELQEGNTRLKFLPHIDTFPGYKPHVTLAYIKGDTETRMKWLSWLNRELVGKTLETRKTLNYGGNHD